MAAGISQKKQDHEEGGSTCRIDPCGARTLIASSRLPTERLHRPASGVDKANLSDAVAATFSQVAVGRAHGCDGPNRLRRSTEQQGDQGKILPPAFASGAPAERTSRSLTLCQFLRAGTGDRDVAGRPSQAWPSGGKTPVRRTVGRTIRAVVLTVALTACGRVEGGDSETQVPPETSSTTTSTPQTTTTQPATTVARVTCADLAAKAVRLAQDARATMRGIAGLGPRTSHSCGRVNWLCVRRRAVSGAQFPLSWGRTTSGRVLREDLAELTGVSRGPWPTRRIGKDAPRHGVEKGVPSNMCS